MNFFLRMFIFFIFSSLIFGILMGGFTIIGLIIGFTFGTLITLIIIPLHIWSLRRKGIWISEETMDVQQTRAFIVYLPYNLAYDLCLRSLITIKKGRVQIDDRARGVIIFKKGMNWNTWGEVISFKVSKIDHNRTDIRVSSKPLFPLTIIDYGSNIDNVERISSFIRAHGYDLSLPGYITPSR